MRVERSAGPWRQTATWLGRIIGLAASALFLVFLIGEGMPEVAAQGIPAELVPFIPLLLLAIAGCIVALFRAREGGVMQLASGGAMAAYHLLHGGMDDLGVALVFGAPFVVAGTIAILCSPGHAATAAR